MNHPLKNRLQSLILGKFSWVRVFRSALLIYLILASYALLFSNGMIFLPPPASYRDSDDITKIRVNADQSISALHLHDDSYDTTIIFIHGNAEDIGHIRPLIESLHAWGFNVLAYDYRGYGTSGGRPSESHAYEDIRAVYRYLTENCAVSPDSIILYGRSIGSGSAVYLAAEQPVGGLVLESAFTSVFRVVFPFSPFPFDRFPNLKRIERIQCPLLIMHGQQDAVIPFRHGVDLFHAAPEPKQSFWVESAGHNDLAFQAGDQYRIALQSFRDLVKETALRKSRVGTNPVD